MKRSIYVIEADSDVVKVGIAIDAQSRLSQLQTGTAIKLKLMYRAECNGDTLKLEREVHRKLRDAHMNGEWFKVTAEFAVATILEAASNLFIELVEGCGSHARRKASKAFRDRRNIDRRVAIKAVLRGVVTISEAASFLGISRQAMSQAVGVKDVAWRRKRFAANALLQMTQVDRKPSKKELRELANRAIAEFEGHA